MVTSAIISDSLSMIEFLDRCTVVGDFKARVVIAGMMSVLHAASVVYIFECVDAFTQWGPKMHIDVLMDPQVEIAMRAYVGPRLNTNIIVTPAPLAYISTILSVESPVHTTLITHGTDLADAIMKMTKPTSVDVNMHVDVTTIEFESRLRSYCSNMGMLVEMCPCGDPTANTVRVIPVHAPGDTEPAVIKHRDMDATMFGKMRWYHRMVRRMPVNSKCYDCSVALVISRAILKGMTGRGLDEPVDACGLWTETFSRQVNVGASVN